MIELKGRISTASKELSGSLFAVPGGVSGGGVLQEKTVNPTTEVQEVTPDDGYYGLSVVTVEAVTLQEKAVTPSNEKQIVTPDEGYSGLSSVTVEAVTVEELPNAEEASF